MGFDCTAIPNHGFELRLEMVFVWRYKNVLSQQGDNSSRARIQLFNHIILRNEVNDST